MKITLKTTAPTILLLISLIAISSCKKETECWSTKAEGKILQQGATTYMYGTHVIESEDGKTIYALASEEVDLDKYLNKVVEIKGNKIKGYPIGSGPEYIKVSKVK